MEKKRSIGVTIIACWFFLQAWIGLGYANELGLLAIVFIAICLVIGIGLWKLFNSARMGAILFFGVASLYCIFVIGRLLTQYSLKEFFEYPNTLVTGTPIAMFIFSTIVFLFLLFFFTRPKVKDQFKQKN